MRKTAHLSPTTPGYAQRGSEQSRTTDDKPQSVLFLPDKKASRRGGCESTRTGRTYSEIVESVGHARYASATIKSPFIINDERGIATTRPPRSSRVECGAINSAVSPARKKERSQEKERKRGKKNKKKQRSLETRFARSALRHGAATARRSLTSEARARYNNERAMENFARRDRRGRSLVWRSAVRVRASSSYRTPRNSMENHRREGVVYAHACEIVSLAITIGRARAPIK